MQSRRHRPRDPYVPAMEQSLPANMATINVHGRITPKPVPTVDMEYVRQQQSARWAAHERERRQAAEAAAARLKMQHHLYIDKQRYHGTKKKSSKRRRAAPPTDEELNRNRRSRHRPSASLQTLENINRRSSRSHH